MIPSPQDLGLPRRFKEWRPGQWEAISDGVECDSRFVVQAQRPGSGKSLSIFAQALLHKGKRSIILTPLKGLQDQMLAFFGSMGLMDMRGKGTYNCEGLPGNTCEDGYAGKCPFKSTTVCNYNNAREEMMEAAIGISNYSCWIAANRYGKGWGKYDVMLLDEVHNAPDQVAKAMSVTLAAKEIHDDLKCSWPDHRSLGDMEAWKYWALKTRFVASTLLDELKEEIERHHKVPATLLKKFTHLQNLVRRLADLATCKPERWVVEEANPGFRFDPINASEYAERILFRGIPKVICTSGSVRVKTMEMLDVNENDMTFFDYPSMKGTSQSPLYYIPTMKINRYVQEWQMQPLINRIDEILESRFALGRKGIIHTANFKLRDSIMKMSKFGDGGTRQLITNRDGQTRFAINLYRESRKPIALVSPSVREGYDFPYDACRFQIIAKIAYSYAGSKVEIARQEEDNDRSAYIGIQSIEQAFGRGDRADDDWQEVFVLDGSMPMLMWKYQDLFSASLLGCYRQMSVVPKPLIPEAA